LHRSILSGIEKREENPLRNKAKPRRRKKQRCFGKTQIQNWVVNPQAWHHIGEDRSYMKTMTHHPRAEIAVEKRSPFSHHQGLAAPDLFLDTMLEKRIWEACPIDYTEVMDNTYGTDPKHITQRVKLIEILSWKSLFISSRLSMRQSMKSSTGVNP
jgi:hypothetical protein